MGGISHHHSEDTKFEDLVAGANVLLNTMLEMATKGLEEKKSDTTVDRSMKRRVMDSSTMHPTKKHKIGGTDQSAERIVLLCIDLQNMEPTSKRSDVDFSDQDLLGWRKNLP